MSEAKEVDTKASSVIAAPDGGGATEKSTGGGAAKEGVIGATATGTKDTPPTKVCADGGVEVQKEVITAVASEDGTPAAKKQKVVCEVTPPDAKETKMCEVCAKRELKAGEIPNKCDRCGKTAVCDYCINACSKCSKCNDSICDMCCFGDWRTRDWHNELTYCELCGERRCGKCGGDDFALLCEDSSKGMVCRECDDVRREEAEMGYF